MKNKVSFDFDSTLDKPSVQKYAKDLIDKGFEVWVITSRPDVYKNHWVVDGVEVKLENNDLFKVTDNLGIPKEQIHFTCYDLKSNFIKGKGFLWHLDDDEVEIESINEETNCVGVLVCEDNWKEKCERIITEFKNIEK